MGITNKYKLLTDAFLGSVKKFSDKPAVYDETSVFTYDELDAASSNIGVEILKMGLEKGTRILIYLPRCKEVVAAALAVCKTGCVFVLSDETFPKERLKFMCKNSETKIILTKRENWEKKHFDTNEARVLFVDEILEAESTQQKISFPKITERDEAFIVYTSGSTGHPKGVLHSQASLFFETNFHPDYEPEADASMKYCHIAGFSFIAGITDLFSPLLCGGSTIIYSDQTRLDPQVLYGKIKEDGVTCLETSTRYAIHFLENYDMRGIVVRMAGEKVPPFKPLYPTIITEIYGCSEGGAVGNFNIKQTNGKIPLAVPSEGVDFALLNRRGHVVKQGEVGELAFSGPSVALCYINLPELTKKKIFEIDGKRWIKTGDLAKCDENGLYYFVERKDFMIKLRGFRIEPGEIEIQIKGYDNGAISDCVCVTKEVGREDRLCCFYSSKEQVDEEKLKKYLSEILAAYLIPEFYVRLVELPKNANGKIDRAQLPEIMIDSDDEVLSSIGLMQLSVEIEEKYGIILEFSKLFALGTRRKVFEYAKQLASSSDSKSKKSKLVEHVKNARLNFAQRGVYLDCIAEPDSLRYNLPTLVKFTDDVSCEDIDLALQDVMEKHPCINVIFKMESDGYVHQILPESVKKREAIALRTISEEELEIYKKIASVLLIY